VARIVANPSIGRQKLRGGVLEPRDRIARSASEEADFGARDFEQRHVLELQERDESARQRGVDGAGSAQRNDLGQRLRDGEPSRNARVLLSQSPELALAGKKQKDLFFEDLVFGIHDAGVAQGPQCTMARGPRPKTQPLKFGRGGTVGSATAAAVRKSEYNRT